MWSNLRGNTVLHIAAGQGCWDGIPEEALTRENMTATNNDGYTPLHVAGGFDPIGEECLLSKVPRTALSWEALTAKDKNGNSVLALATKHGELDSLLGAILPEEGRKVVGDSWFERNLGLLREMSGKEPRIEEERGSEGLDIEL